MGILKQAYNFLKEKKEINKFMNQIKPGVNCFMHKYDTRYRLEITTCGESKYIIQEYKGDNLKTSIMVNKSDLPKEIYKNNLYKNIEKVNHYNIKNFFESIEPGFNYMENRYNPRNYIEIYRSTEDKYKIEEYSSKKLVKTYEAKDNNDFKKYVEENNYHNNMKKVNYFKISKITDNNYDVKNNLENMKNNIDSVRENINELKKQFKEDKPKRYHENVNINEITKNKGMER